MFLHETLFIMRNTTRMHTWNSVIYDNVYQNFLLHPEAKMHKM